MKGMGCSAQNKQLEVGKVLRLGADARTTAVVRRMVAVNMVVAEQTMAVVCTLAGYTVLKEDSQQRWGKPLVAPQVAPLLAVRQDKHTAVQELHVLEGGYHLAADMDKDVNQEPLLSTHMTQLVQHRKPERVAGGTTLQLGGVHTLMVALGLHTGVGQNKNKRAGHQLADSL